jgi:hypothetical protein
MIRSLLIASLFLTPLAVFACDLEDATRLQLDDDVSLYYRVTSPPIMVAKHFAMQFRFCRERQPLSIDRFKLDASMPAHGHGMNYRASIVSQDEGRFEARGLMFHMPGKWQLKLDFSA